MSVDQAPDRAVVSGLSGRYATALFDLAREEKSIDTVDQELSALTGAIASNKELSLLVSSPRIERSQKVKAVSAIAQKSEVSEITTKFLGALAQNGRLGALHDIAVDFKTLIAHQRGETTAEVTAAHPLSDAQMDALKSKLRAAMGRDVAVNVTVDEALLGGLVVKVGSKMIDSSLRTKLSRLEIAMKGAG